MRAGERLLVYGGVLAAVVTAWAARDPSGSAMAQGGQPAAPRLATLDVFLVTEKLMDMPERKDKREALIASWRQRVEAMQQGAKQLYDQGQILPMSDPKYRELSMKYQQTQEELQKVSQQAAAEVDHLGAAHLIESYEIVRDAARAVGVRLGHTYVLSSRSPYRKIESTTVGATLQEMLARPVLRGVEADDITEAVLTELKLK